MIFGVTHSDSGVPRQRLTVAYKASIGVPGTDGKNYPEKLDHFRIVAKNEKGDWIEDPTLTKLLQEKYCNKVLGEDGKERFSKLREFDIVFLQDPPEVQLPDGTTSWNLEEMFRTELAWWSATERLCYGNGKSATRSFNALTKAEQDQNAGVRAIAWTKCGDGCPQYDDGKCKPTANLSYLFKDLPRIGSVAAFNTTSFESIQRIQGSLMQILQFTGGRLRGIALRMVLRPGKTKYTDKDGKRKIGNAFFVNIEFRHEDYATIVPQLLEQSATYAKNVSRARLLTEHIDDDVIDVDLGPESERAKEMSGEFYPESRQIAETQTTSLKELDDACSVADLNAAQRDALVNAFKGSQAEASTWLVEFNTLAKTSGKTPVQIKEMFSKALLQTGAMESMFNPVQPTETPATTNKGATRTRKASTPPPPTPDIPATTGDATPTADPQYNF